MSWGVFFFALAVGALVAATIVAVGLLVMYVVAQARVGEAEDEF